MQVTEGTAADVDGILALLDAAGLPRPTPAEPVRWLVARDGAAVAGCVGLEAHGDAVLLRSLAVRPDRRGAGLGRALAVAAVAAAGGRDVFLLTLDHAGFFARLGFAPVDRASAPEAVRRSGQFAGGCCSSATCMRLRGA